jgi:transposase
MQSYSDLSKIVPVVNAVWPEVVIFLSPALEPLTFSDSGRCIVLGHKARNFRQHVSISLEDLVPQDNFYRQVERSIDLSFIRDLANEFYSSLRRPSIDPLVFFKLQLIAFFEGVRSERQLMETVNLNLAHRWFIGYDLDEPVPDHSSLSKIRERYGLKAFQQFFECIVKLCIEAGLVWGEELYFDSAKVQANVSINGKMDRAEFAAQQHLDQLFERIEEDGSAFFLSQNSIFKADFPSDTDFFNSLRSFACTTHSFPPLVEKQKEQLSFEYCPQLCIFVNQYIAIQINASGSKIAL